MSQVPSKKLREEILKQIASGAKKGAALGGGLGALSGALTGYGLTEDEEKKLRNSLIGAVGGGIGGSLGGYHLVSKLKKDKLLKEAPEHIRSMFHKKMDIRGKNIIKKLVRSKDLKHAPPELRKLILIELKKDPAFKHVSHREIEKMFTAAMSVYKFKDLLSERSDSGLKSRLSNIWKSKKASKANKDLYSGNFKKSLSKALRRYYNQLNESEIAAGQVI